MSNRCRIEYRKFCVDICSKRELFWKNQQGEADSAPPSGARVKMERSQTWPDLGSPISKFRDKHFMDTVTDINHWKFQGDRSFGLAMANIQFFSEVRSLDVTWWPDLESPGSEILQHVWKRMNRCAKMGAPPFFRYLRKTRGVLNTGPPPPGPARHIVEVYFNKKGLHSRN